MPDSVVGLTDTAGAKSSSPIFLRPFSLPLISAFIYSFFSLVFTGLDHLLS